MTKVVYDHSNNVSIVSLSIDGRTIGHTDDVKIITVDTDCGYWDIQFNSGDFINSTGNVFICCKHRN